MKYVMILSVLVLSACATGPIYQSLDTPKNKAEIVVYSPSGLGNPQAIRGLNVNGKVCNLLRGGHTRFLTNPGPTAVKADLFGSFGVSEIILDTKGGQKYIVRASLNNSKLNAGIFAGAIGEYITEKTDPSPGPFYLKLISEDSAQPELSQTKNVDCD